jgi:hypothetical protein
MPEKPEWEVRLDRYQEEHEKRMAEWDRRMAESDKQLADFKATMYGYHVRAESDMLEIREKLNAISSDVQKITTNMEVLTRMMTGDRSNGKEGEGKP